MNSILRCSAFEMRLRNMKQRTLLMSLATMLWATTASVAKGYFARARMLFRAPVQVGYLNYFRSFFVEEVKPPPPFFSWEYLTSYLADDVKTWWALNAKDFDLVLYLLGIIVCYGICQLLRNVKMPCWFCGFTSGSTGNEERAKESPAPSTGSPFPSGSPDRSNNESSNHLNKRINFIEGILNQCLQEKQQMREEQSALLEKLRKQSEEFEKFNFLDRLETMGGIMREQESDEESERSDEEVEKKTEASNTNHQQAHLIETEDSIILL